GLELVYFFFQAEDGIRDWSVTGVQTCALPILRDDAEAIAPELVGLRRAIHREPEIGLDLPGTQRKVLAALDGLPLEISLGTALSSVTAVLRGEGPPALGAADASDAASRPALLL